MKGERMKEAREEVRRREVVGECQQEYRED